MSGERVQVGSLCACAPVLPSEANDFPPCPAVWRRWPSGSLACDCGECVQIPAAQRSTTSSPEVIA